MTDRFDTTTKFTIKMFRFYIEGASSCCKLPKPFCNSNSIVNIQILGKYCFPWYIPADKYKIDKTASEYHITQSICMNLIKVINKCRRKLKLNQQLNN